MRVRSRSVFATVALTLACPHAATAQSPAVKLVPPPTGVPAPTQPRIDFDEFDRVTAAAGLPILRTTTLPSNDREVRIWIGGGLGWPQSLYRWTDRKGKVAGMLVLHWPAGGFSSPDTDRAGESFDDLIRYHQEGRCTRFRRKGNTGVCVAQFSARPDWAGVLRQAELAGLWSLPDESTLPRDNNIVTFDGWGITVELRHGTQYRAYEYSNPDARPGSPEAARATAISGALSAINSLVRPSAVERVYRGEAASGPSLSEFRECASRERWGLQGMLDGISSASSNRPRADTLTTGVKRQYVEVRGTLAPEWLSRRWQSEYPRVLEVAKVIAAQPWSESACR